MSLNFISEVWDTLRHHIDSNDRLDAAENLINLLIDNNFEPDDIKDAFRSSKEIIKALKYYAEQHDSEEEEDEDDDPDGSDDEW